MVRQPKTPQTTCFARRLREARLRLGVSQMGLGVMAGIDEMSASPRINQYERGKHVPDIAMMARLAEVLGVPTPYFFAEDDLLAQWIVAYGRLNQVQRLQLLCQVEAGV